MKDVWPRRVLAEVLGGAADDLLALSNPPRTMWKVQVDAAVQSSATLQVALAARLAGCSWLGIAKTLNANGLKRMVNVPAVLFEDWDRHTVARATLAVPREPGLGHVLGWFAREFCGGDILEAVWIISAMDGTMEHQNAQEFTDALRAPGLERALAIARSAAEGPTGRVETRTGPLRRDFRQDAAAVARSCWYFLFGPGAQGRLGHARVLTQAFRVVAADAVEEIEALEFALTEREQEIDAEEKAARLRMVEHARRHDRGKR